eukprot:6479868-Amphidinium_carterae.1
MHMRTFVYCPACLFLTLSWKAQFRTNKDVKSSITLDYACLEAGSIISIKRTTQPYITRGPTKLHRIDQKQVTTIPVGLSTHLSDRGRMTSCRIGAQTQKSTRDSFSLSDLTTVHP